jgi:tRNA-Thr(GGU) m(6)t(6)A37 methyltransferase TsaA
MVRLNEIRDGELAVTLPARADAEVYFIGRIRTPWSDRLACPRQGRADGPTCCIELFEPWDRGLDHVADFERLEVLYWLHESRRDLTLQAPKNDGQGRGVFSLRTPVRPNPIGTSIVQLIKVEGSVLLVRGLDCLDGTPLIDLKPDRTLFKPLAPAQPGDFEVGESA